MRFTRAVLRGWVPTDAAWGILNWEIEAAGGIGTSDLQSGMKVVKKGNNTS